MSAYSDYNKFQNSEIQKMSTPNILNTAISLCLCQNSAPYSVFDTFSVFLVEWTENEQTRSARELSSFEKYLDASKFLNKVMAEMNTH